MYGILHVHRLHNILACQLPLMESVYVHLKPENLILKTILDRQLVLYCSYACSTHDLVTEVKFVFACRCTRPSVVPRDANKPINLPMLAQANDIHTTLQTARSHMHWTRHEVRMQANQPSHKALLSRKHHFMVSERAHRTGKPAAVIIDML